MTFPSLPAASSVLTPEDELTHKRFEFRALLAREGSPARAAALYAEHAGDAAFACHEMLRDHALLPLDETTAALHAAIPADDEDGRSQAAQALVLQRWALRAHATQGRIFTAIGDRDAILLRELAGHDETLAADGIDPALRAVETRDRAIDQICRRDLAAYVRIALEQQAMREFLAARRGATPSAALLDELVDVATQRVEPLKGAISGGQPLRRVLRGEIAVEAERAEARVAERLTSAPERAAPVARRAGVART